MLSKDIIVIGASAGGVDALGKLIHGLPGDLPASLLVVLHTRPDGPGTLGNVLQRAGRLRSANATNGEPVRPGHIYVAPPDHHLLLEGTTDVRIIRLTRGPKENRFRPAIDTLFRSAALSAGPRVVGVVLTGMLDDGTAGLWAIKDQGGTTVVQDPEEALMPSMPRSALEHVEVDHCVSLMKMPRLLSRLAGKPADQPETKAAEQMRIEVEIAKARNPLEAGSQKLGEPTRYTCPECHGVLSQIKEGKNIRFRCHTGHAYSLDSLLAESSERTEDGLWNAVRSMQESVLLLENTAAQLGDGQDQETARALQQKVKDLRRRAEVVRQVAMNNGEPRTSRRKRHSKSASREKRPA
jgi:two-component system, chemotaxis family, protein-glutamate methylesterase/glutaminase